MFKIRNSFGFEGLVRNVEGLLQDTQLAFKDLHRWEKPIFLFWLAGPFILLIERSPADIWLSILAVLFLVKIILHRDFSWVKNSWVMATLLFWCACLVAAAISVNPIYSLSESVVWIRFPLFAMATAFWLGRDRRLLNMMIFIVGVGMVVMSAILAAELVIEGQKGGRLLWPYGDKNPGNYLAKAGMPAFCVMVALAFNSRSKLAYVLALLVTLSLLISVAVGERINFILRFCASILGAFSWKFERSNILIKLLFFTFIVLGIAVSQGGGQGRFTSAIISDLPFSENSDYFRVMGGGLIAFADSPWLGIGTATYRLECPDLLPELSSFRCDNHPHNYYIQLLAETGIIGFLCGVLMIGSIILTTFKEAILNNRDVVSSTAFIVPLAMFFPIQSTADFFGQWNNIFMWSAIAISLAAAHSEPMKHTLGFFSNSVNRGR